MRMTRALFKTEHPDQISTCEVFRSKRRSRITERYFFLDK